MHLFLVGPPGIGKSTVAPLLARMLGASVIETDRAIARRARKSNKDVIEQDGMESFRDLESRVIASLRPTPAWIVASLINGPGSHHIIYSTAATSSLVQIVPDSVTSPCRITDRRGGAAATTPIDLGSPQ